MSGGAEMITRRQGLSAMGFSIGWFMSSRGAGASPITFTKLPTPDPKKMESGDLVWPKKPGTFVPYDAGPPRDPSADEVKWQAERDQFISEVATKAPYFTPQAVERLRNMTYREFYAEYAGAQKPETPGVYSIGGGLYVGHVAIIEIDQNGKRWVIEALLDQGVIRHSYADWIAGRPEEMVWLGRVKKISSSNRAKIAIEAKKYIGRPYDFWNFDLNDERGFYCSKLAWMCMFRALGLVIDGNPDPKRFFWFSPKQLLYVNRVARLFDPGPYGIS
jgi:hypothetical protein